MITLIKKESAQIKNVLKIQKILRRHGLSAALYRAKKYKYLKTVQAFNFGVDKQGNSYPIDKLVFFEVSIVGKFTRQKEIATIYLNEHIINN